jgi:hypothetical protein
MRKLKINKTEKKNWRNGLHYNFDPSGKKKGYLSFYFSLGGFGIEICNPSKDASKFKIYRLIKKDKK